MNTKTIIITAVAVFAIVILGIFCVQGTKNGAIAREQNVEQAKSDIDVMIDRKINLLTELVQCVEQYDEYEYNTLMAIIEARANNADGDVNATEIMNEVQAIAEAYPELQSQKNYANLMLNISETENLLANHKKAYNTTVKDYNTYVRKFPNSTFLGMAGYTVIEYELYSTTNTDQPMTLFK